MLKLVLEFQPDLKFQVDEDVSDDGIEFCLELSQSTAANHHSAAFHTVYVGPDYSFLVRDLKAGEPYLLRVASRREGSSSFGPLSLVQSAVTNIPHFSMSLQSLFFRWDPQSIVTFSLL